MGEQFLVSHAQDWLASEPVSFKKSAPDSGLNLSGPLRFSRHGLTPRESTRLYSSYRRVACCEVLRFRLLVYVLSLVFVVATVGGVLRESL